MTYETLNLHPAPECSLCGVCVPGLPLEWLMWHPFSFGRGGLLRSEVVRGGLWARVSDAPGSALPDAWGWMYGQAASRLSPGVGGSVVPWHCPTIQLPLGPFHVSLSPPTLCMVDKGGCEWWPPAKLSLRLSLHSWRVSTVAGLQSDGVTCSEFSRMPFPFCTDA